MLVLSRKVGERIVVGDKITITVVRLGKGSVRIGIEAPDDMAIVREELLRPPRRTANRWQSCRLHDRNSRPAAPIEQHVIDLAMNVTAASKSRRDYFTVLVRPSGPLAPSVWAIGRHLITTRHHFTAASYRTHGCAAGTGAAQIEFARPADRSSRHVRAVEKRFQPGDLFCRSSVPGLARAGSMPPVILSFGSLVPATHRQFKEDRRAFRSQ